MWKRTNTDRTRGLLLTGLKAAGSAAVAIAVASAIHLQFSATAGIIAILSLMGTKRETMKVALGRLMAYGAALLIAFVCFTLFGDGLLAFGIYLFVFASLCYACSWGYAHPPLPQAHAAPSASAHPPDEAMRPGAFRPGAGAGSSGCRRLCR